jgi:catechol 2,3-dioxygenase-like lactoylglutathione lyase family enzyme
MHVDHIGLSVADLDEQQEWYRRALGFDTARPFEIAPVGVRGVFVLGPDDIAIELLERQGSTVVHQPASTPPDALLSRGWAHLCLRVDDVDAAFARVVDAGAGILSSPADSPEPGVRFAFVTDPEGNLIELLDRIEPVHA